MIPARFERWAGCGDEQVKASTLTGPRKNEARGAIVPLVSLQILPLAMNGAVPDSTGNTRDPTRSCQL